MSDTYVRRRSQPEFPEKVSKVPRVGGGCRDCPRITNVDDRPWSSDAPPTRPSARGERISLTLSRLGIQRFNRNTMNGRMKSQMNVLDVTRSGAQHGRNGMIVKFKVHDASCTFVLGRMTRWITIVNNMKDRLEIDG